MKKLLLMLFIFAYSDVYSVCFNATHSASKKSTKLSSVLNSSSKRQYNDLCIFPMEMSDSSNTTSYMQTPIKEKNRKEFGLVKSANVLENTNSQKNFNKKTHKKRNKKKNNNSLDMYFASSHSKNHSKHSLKKDEENTKPIRYNPFFPSFSSENQ